MISFGRDFVNNSDLAEKILKGQNFTPYEDNFLFGNTPTGYI